MLRKFIFVMAGLAMILPSIAAAPAAAAQQQQRRELVVTPQSGLQPTRSLTIPINKSEVFHVNQPIAKVGVGNAEIADVVVVNNQSFYIFGKKSGSTNVMVFDQNSQLLAVLDIIVGADIEAIKRALYEGLPRERIAVRAVNGTFSLSGTVNSPAKVNQAMDIARRFVDKDQTVINNLQVTGTQQVMLEVKVAEMQRTVTRSLGFKPFLSIGRSGKSGFTLSTLDPVNLTNFALLAGTAISGNFAFTELLDALEQKGAAKVLAEPNLVAMSGDTASFLAGGEFPVPIVQSSSGTGGLATVSVEFKQFGVSLAFTPTVVDGDLINLIVAPEVSQLNSNVPPAVNLNGFNIPGVDTRRAKTTVELRDGQSFAIAGLLSSDFNDTIRGIPGLMDVPVLGTLFHSTQYQRNETELVILVTPRLVQPVPAGTLVAPTDTFVPPSDTEMIFYGRSENPDSGLPPAGGGLTGKYGHIIR